MKTTQEKIAVMQGEVDGKTIRATVRGKGNWYIVSTPISWNWVSHDYEIKREPLERWVNVYPGEDDSIAFSSHKIANECSIPGALRVAVHMREVTGEDDG